MMLSETLAAAVNRRSIGLIEEFRAHVEECRQHHGQTDEHLIFAGWAIQKIASLQLAAAAAIRDLTPEEQERRILAASAAQDGDQ